MAEEQQERSSHSILSGQPSSAAPIPTNLGDILEAQKHAILSAVNFQIQNLQTNLLTAQAELSSRIVAESQADTYAFKKKGNEQQFKFNQTVIKKTHAALRALEGTNIAQAKEELAEGMALLQNRQKLIKLADKSEFGWATVQEYIDDELADDEADASKIRKVEKRAGARVKSLQEKKRKTVQPKPVTAVSNSITPTPHSVAHGPSHLISRIFGPKGDTRHIVPTPSKLSTCVFDAANENIGLVPVPSGTSQMPNIPAAEDGWEIEQDVHYCASEFVLDIMEHGYKITPPTYSIENRSSATRRDSFVREAISEFLAGGCVREVTNYPEFCNPLHVAVQSSRKLRLILDLYYLNSFVVKQSIKYEDLRCVLQMFPSGMFTFCFDLKSAYHHIDICAEHMKFLSFKWPTGDGRMKFYEFTVLPFGLTSAPYVFTKVLRQLIRFWRGHGHRVLLYLDDGIGGNFCQTSATRLSIKVRQDIIACGFTLNDEKSVWEPTQIITFLGVILNFVTGTIHIPERGLAKLKGSLATCLNTRFVSARELASITGQIIAMSCAVGNLTRLLTRNCYSAIEAVNHWDHKIVISPEIR